MARITEDYVSFEVAKLLKEKGFDVPCNCYGAYDGVGLVYRLCITSKYTNWNKHTDTDIISCPTLQMAMKWLREVHRLFICVEIGVGCYAWNITNTTDYVTVYVDATVGTYEKVCEAAIKYCLENII